MKSKEQGFTLTVLMTVVIIIVMLTVITLPHFTRIAQAVESGAGSHETSARAFSTEGCKKLDNSGLMECAEHFYAHGEANLSEVHETKENQRAEEAVMISTLLAIYDAASYKESHVSSLNDASSNKTSSKAVVGMKFGDSRFKSLMKDYQDATGGETELTGKLYYGENDYVGFNYELVFHTSKVKQKTTRSVGATKDKEEARAILEHSGSFKHAQSELSAFLKRNGIKRQVRSDDDSVDVVLLISKKLMLSAK